ncbi:hypothetical protein D0Z03_001847 [Geotrichum reessii]|nr:hypothetical protein D0Z03_001847 [Galactomyces reessii]
MFVIQRRALPLFSSSRVLSHISARKFHSSHSYAEALKIAFCGSDGFSTESFKALLAYQQSHPDRVSSVDLITRQPKPKGRGRTIIEQTAIQQYIESDAARAAAVACFTPESDVEFAELQQKRAYDLVIAVSYGRLIPEKFLASLRYGGLNVHPSLLPRYRGAAPLHAALLNRDAYTGVSVQTLHPTKFDHGVVLFQTQEIPINTTTETLQSLTEKLAPLGAQGLIHVLDQEYYKDPAHHAVDTTKYNKSYTKKVTTESRKIDLAVDSVETALAKYRVFQSIYLLHEFVVRNKKKRTEEIVIKRVQLEGMLEDVTTDFITQCPNLVHNMNTGEYYLDIADKATSRLVFKLKDGFISAKSIKMETYSACDAQQLSLSLKKRGIVKQHFI